MKIAHLKVPKSLRAELGKPLGELIEGSPEKISEIIINRFEKYKGIIICVGDIVSQSFVNNNIIPDLIITDGITKRQKIQEQVNYSGFVNERGSNLAGEISINAWEKIRKIINAIKQERSNKFHLRIDGEEDLLVIPAAIELKNSKCYSIIYGQPDKGIVILNEFLSKTFLIENLLEKMEK